MTDHSGLLDRYLRMREVRFRLNNLLVKTIPKKTLEECGRILGFFRKGTLFFETEDETSVLMDYCIFLTLLLLSRPLVGADLHWC